MKHSFYPSELLEQTLRADAKQKKQTIRKTVCDILEAYYGLNGANSTGAADNSIHKIMIDDDASIVDNLECNDIEYVDKRDKGGTLWIYDFSNASTVLKHFEITYKCKFVYSAKGSKATQNHPGWYLVK